MCIKTNEYTKAVNVANKFMDAMFDAFNLKNPEKYHIKEDDLKTVAENAKEKMDTSKQYVKELANGLKVDLSDFANTLKDLLGDYEDKYTTKPEHECKCDFCKDVCCEDSECECDDDCYDLFDEEEDYCEVDDADPVNYTQNYCHTIKDRLASEFKAETLVNSEDDNTDPSYPYNQVLQDINEMLDDIEGEYYTLIPANDECKCDTVCLEYSLGFENEAELDLYANEYMSKLTTDLRELYGFSAVHIHVLLEPSDEYLTYKIYMML